MDEPEVDAVAVGDLPVIPNELYTAGCNVELQGARRSLIYLFDTAEMMDETLDVAVAVGAL